MITASERASKLSGQSNAIKADDLIAFIIEEAQHQVINDERTKTAESALAAHAKKTGNLKAKRKMTVSPTSSVKTAVNPAIQSLTVGPKVEERKDKA